MISVKICLSIYFNFIWYVVFISGFSLNSTHVSFQNTYKTPPVRNKNAQNQVPIESIVQGLYLKDLAICIGTTLRGVSNRELGVPVMQEIYDSLKYTPTVEDNKKKITDIVNKLSKKLTEALEILYKSKEVIEQHSGDIAQNDKILSTLYPCPHVPSTYLWNAYNKLYSNNNSKAFVSYSSLLTNENPAFNLSQVFSKYITSASQGGAGIKQMYYLSSFDVASSVSSHKADCTIYDNTVMWHEYISRINYGQKNILILLDHGNSLSNHQLYLAKSVAKSIIEMLDFNDTVSIIGLSETCIYPFIIDQCTIMTNFNQSAFVPLTDFNKNVLINFIDSLTKSNGATNHTLGFEQAFNTIRTFVDNGTDINNIMLLYISRGLLSSLTDAKIILQLIANEGKNIRIPVIINTCPVIDDAKPLLYEKHFMLDIAYLNFTKYNIEINDGSNANLQRGMLQAVNSTYNVGLVAARFISTLWNKTGNLNTDVKISQPLCDSFSKDITVTLSTACGKFGELGTFAIDLYFTDLVEDVIYSGIHPKDSYVFLIDTEGFTIVHKSYPVPNSCQERQEAIGIELLEKVKEFSIVKQKMLSHLNGSYNVTNEKNETVQYTWQRVLDWYVLCIVSTNKKMAVQRLKRVSLPENAELLHHRLDLLPPPSVCRHLKQIATLDSGTLYLSPFSFESPYSQLRGKWGSETSPLTLQSYMAYIKDHTGLLANPGFKPDIRNDVISLLHMMSYLKRQHLNGALRQYAVRRYVASSSGVLEVFPGVLLQPGLEPIRRPWYQKAIEYPGRVVLTPPYLDAGGAGYIVTLSHAVYKGNDSSMHTTKDSTVAVMAIDLTLGYFYKLITEKMSFCALKNVRCFVMDDKGYLISHPSLIDPNGKGPVEQTHIVHKESLVANDILNHKYFVKKILCNNFADGTMQRYYQFNTSFVGTITNSFHNEHCIRYQISSIPGTNLFVGVVNSTCEVSATFCPCSMVDRLCLNCNRMEQTECECPCECPLNLHKLSCPNPNMTLTRNPTCPLMFDQGFPTITVGYSKMINLKSCMQFHCEQYTSYDSCMGVLGCEWCQIDIDGETSLGIPFCTTQLACFGGVLGSVTPYGDGPSGASGDLLVSTHSPVGPVAGSVVVLCLVLALILHCYRQNSGSSSERLYPDSGPDNIAPQVRMSCLELDEMHEERDGHRELLMAYKIEAVSPYRISANYRRPPTTGDSDHGYSTMTPHDESEHLSVALIEPLLNQQDEGTASDIGSNSTSNLSNTKSVTNVSTKNVSNDSIPNDMSMTRLPNKNFMLAPVTVHRIMETT